MDFRLVARRLTTFFEEIEQPVAIIGGFALLAYGIQRATFDLDFVTSQAARDAVIAFLEAEGYETLHRSASYSNHLHPSSDLGRIDFVYVDAETAAKLFAAARPTTLLGQIDVLTPKPEHLAAMKVRALANDPSRRLQDLRDIQQLLGLPGIDREEVRGYFAAVDLEYLYEQHLRGTIGD